MYNKRLPRQDVSTRVEVMPTNYFLEANLAVYNSIKEVTRNVLDYASSTLEYALDRAEDLVLMTKGRRARLAERRKKEVAERRAARDKAQHNPSGGSDYARKKRQKEKEGTTLRELARKKSIEDDQRRSEESRGIYQPPVRHETPSWARILWGDPFEPRDRNY